MRWTPRHATIADMTKIEQLTAMAQPLPDDQLDGLIAYARYLSSEPHYYSLPADVLASIERGAAEHAAGQSVPAEDALRRLRNRIDAAR